MMKIALLKKLLITALCGLAFANAVAHAEDLLDQVKQRGTLRIALEGTYPPFNFKDANGDLKGYGVDIAKAVAAKLGVKPVFITTEWNGIIAGLESGKYDVIVNQVGITEARKKVFDFSPPYTYSIAQLVQRKDDKRTFASLAALKGHTLGVALGSNYDDMAKAVPGIDVRTYPAAPEYLQDLVNHKIDAALNDRLMLAYLLEKSPLGPQLRKGATVGNYQASGIPFVKGNPKFKQALDNAIEALKQNGSLKRISLKWFGDIDASVPPPGVPAVR